MEEESGPVNPPTSLEINFRFVYRRATASIFGGTLVSLFTMPFEVAKVRIQTGLSSSIPMALNDAVKQEGSLAELLRFFQRL
jgi:hypothetical protein